MRTTMAVHKYLFYIREKGIVTYRANNSNKYEIVKYHGEDMYTGLDLKGFSQWVGRMAGISSDDFIDFCFLSTNSDVSTLFEHSTKDISSWSKKEIIDFCNKMLDLDNFEVVVDGERKFICQNGNCFDKDSIKRLYLKCIPEFSCDNMTEKETGANEGSILYTYYSQVLSELG